MQQDRILMGVIGRPHGVRGLVRLMSYASTPEVLEAHVLHDDRGRSFRIAWRGEGIAAIRPEGGREIADRDAAVELTNLRLSVDRHALPEPGEDEFYHADLVGLAAFDEAGTRLGTVRAVHDYGAGTSLEIGPDVARDRAPILVAFTRASVPVVEPDRGRVVIRLPDEIEWHPEPVSGTSVAGEEDAA